MAKYFLAFADTKFFVLDNSKSPDDAFAVEIDISEWLGEDTISAVSFSASGAVLDGDKNTYTDTIIRPYLKNGIDGLNYIIAMKVTTTAGDVGSFYLRFACRDLSS